MSAKPSSVLILGYGEMGHAMEHMLRARHRLTVWQRPAPGRAAVDLESAARTCDFVLFCVPTGPIAALAARIKPHLGPESISLTVAKGLDEHGRTAAAALAHVYGADLRYGVVYGPMIAEEIRRDRPAFAAVALSRENGYERVARLFADTALSLTPTTDLNGTSWCAVLKNVYAILFGMADELDLGDNARGFLTVAATAELCALLGELGGEAATAYGIAGLGDLVTTATSAGSHHHDLGRRIARGDPGPLKGEGVHTLSMVEKHRLFDRSRFPLLRFVAEAIRDPARLAERLRDRLAGWNRPDPRPRP